MGDSSPERSIAAIWGIESPRLIAALTRVVRDVGLAEELAQDAFVAALEQWPNEGIPRNPGAWLTAVAKRRAIDRFRRDRMMQRKHEDLGRELRKSEILEPDFEALNHEVGDDLLRLIFIACHPVLSLEARVALTLRLLGGLTTPEIARAFLVSESTMAQRIVRAKRTLAEARVPFDMPDAHERAERLEAVLGVVYLIFNEGYAASSGEDVLRPQLAHEALRLGRMLAKLSPHEPEVHGLLALMEIQSSRMKARVSPNGEPVLLLDQDRSRWDHLAIARGLTALGRAERAGRALGPYTLQAEIAACHARARTADLTDWQRIAALYDALAQIAPSPVVELNRAVAFGMAFGPQAGLDVIDSLADAQALKSYHLLPSVRADLLEKLGRLTEARDEYERAATLAQNARDRTLLSQRAARCRF